MIATTRTDNPDIAAGPQTGAHKADRRQLDLLARRDELMAELDTRLKSPRRADLSVEDWKRWQEIGSINQELRRLDAEANITRQEIGEKLRKGKEAMAFRCEQVAMALAKE